MEPLKEFYLVGGKQGIHSHTMTQNIEALHAISREHEMERLWMAASDAAELGIADRRHRGGKPSFKHTGQVPVGKVTERMKPGVLFLPTHYGGDAPRTNPRQRLRPEHDGLHSAAPRAGRAGSTMSQKWGS